jgi:hypothetical protein
VAETTVFVGFFTLEFAFARSVANMAHMKRAGALKQTAPGWVGRRVCRDFESFWSRIFGLFLRPAPICSAPVYHRELERARFGVWFFAAGRVTPLQIFIDHQCSAELRGAEHDIFVSPDFRPRNPRKKLWAGATDKLRYSALSTQCGSSN